MKMDATTDALWVLYLVNVLQPVTRDTLEAQTRRLMRSLRRKPKGGIDITRSLSDLAGANMTILLSDGRYSVTALGLQKLSAFKLGRVRDKNRMFELKDRFKR
jgi:hypothetical protein